MREGGKEEKGKGGKGIKHREHGMQMSHTMKGGDDESRERERIVSDTQKLGIPMTIKEKERRIKGHTRETTEEAGVAGNKEQGTGSLLRREDQQKVDVGGRDTFLCPVSLFASSLRAECERAMAQTTQQRAFCRSLASPSPFSLVPNLRVQEKGRNGRSSEFNELEDRMQIGSRLWTHRETTRKKRSERKRGREGEKMRPDEE